MGDALRDNLQKANPAPMFFAVKATNTGKHFVTQVAGDVGGKPGILVTMNCPADSGDS
jgi:hypothetical protein